MYIKILIILLISVSLSSYSQETYYDIDKKSFELFTAKKWKDLIILNNEVDSKLVDYLYYNLRIGTAYFYENQFFKAEKYFLKALKQQAGDKYAMSYLSGIYKILQLDLQASQYQIEDEKLKILDFIYAEVGTKIPTKKDVGIINLATIGANVKVKKNASLYFAYTGIIKDVENVNFLQNDGFINSNIYIKNGLTVIPALHFSVLNANVASNFDTTYFNIIPYHNTKIYDSVFHKINYNSITKPNSISVFPYLAVLQRIGRFTVQPYTAYNLILNNYNTKNTYMDSIRIKEYDDQTLVLDSSFVYVNTESEKFNNKNLLQFGVDMFYTLPIFQDRITLLGNVNFIYQDSLTTFFGGGISYLATNNLNVKLEYTHYLNSKNFLQSGGSIYNNSIDKKFFDISLLGSYSLKKTSIYLSYKLEKLERSEIFYSNTIVLGLKYKL